LFGCVIIAAFLRYTRIGLASRRHFLHPCLRVRIACPFVRCFPLLLFFFFRDFLIFLRSIDGPLSVAPSTGSFLLLPTHRRFISFSPVPTIPASAILGKSAFCRAPFQESPGVDTLVLTLGSSRHYVHPFRFAIDAFLVLDLSTRCARAIRLR